MCEETSPGVVSEVRRVVSKAGAKLVAFYCSVVRAYMLSPLAKFMRELSVSAQRGGGGGGDGVGA